MADELTAASRAAGFGATEQKSDNSDQINDLLNQARDLMIQDGTDPATAEALTNYARPASPAVAGNLADLMRMGQIAVKGSVDTPPGQADIPATNLEEAFAEPPAPDLNTGLQTPMGQIDGEGNPIGGNGGSDTSSMTKAELQAELDNRGIEYSSSATKAELQELLDS